MVYQLDRFCSKFTVCKLPLIVFLHCGRVHHSWWDWFIQCPLTLNPTKTCSIVFQTTLNPNSLVVKSSKICFHLCLDVKPQRSQMWWESSFFPRNEHLILLLWCHSEGHVLSGRRVTNFNQRGLFVMKKTSFGNRAAFFQPLSSLSAALNV